MIHLERDAQERLLGRPVRAVLSAPDHERFAGERIVVTGAGGSVGGELVRQLAQCGPASLTLVDHSEYHLFQIERELRESLPQVRANAVLGDVTRRADIQTVCQRVRPHVVFHAAAYKHVTMAERSVVAAARVNVLGAVETARAAALVRSRFVLVSSDKAAEPASVMGATKRLAELLTLKEADHRFRPIVVRFGNVLGSSGSVVEIMLRAVREQRPVPITDPAATRFFMTGEEAASLMLRADLMGEGGDVFWLDMGEPLRIGDLAERVIALATPPGAPRPGIELIGLRPGEKMNEALTAQGLAMEATSHASIWKARQAGLRHTLLQRAYAKLRRACALGDGIATLDAIARGVEGFRPSEAALRAASGRDVDPGFGVDWLTRPARAIA